MRGMSKESARWMSASKVIPMFPTLVWKVQLETQLRKRIDTKMLDALARMRKEAHPLAPGQGWQSIQTLHTLEEFRELVTCVRRVVAGILRFLKIDYGAFEMPVVALTTYNTDQVVLKVQPGTLLVFPLRQPCTRLTAGQVMVLIRTFLVTPLVLIVATLVVLALGLQAAFAASRPSASTRRMAEH